MFSFTYVYFAILLMFLYRLRGGGFYKFSGDTVTRILFAIAANTWYDLTSGNWLNNGIATPGLVIYIGAVFVSEILPHGAFQDMGRTPYAERDFSFFLPDYTPDEWNALPFYKRTLYDFAGMAFVGFTQATIMGAALWYFFSVNIHALALGAVIMSLGSALSYLVCYYIPFRLGPTKYSDIAEPRSTGWAELFVGLVWFAYIITIS